MYKMFVSGPVIEDGGRELTLLSEAHVVNALLGKTMLSVAGVKKFIERLHEDGIAEHEGNGPYPDVTVMVES